MPLKLNNENCLQDWKLEHLAVTAYMVHLADIDNLKDITSKNLVAFWQVRASNRQTTPNKQTVMCKVKKRIRSQKGFENRRLGSTLIESFD